MSSAQNYPSDIRSAQSIGADLYLTKPFELRVILDAVGKLLPA